MTAGGPLKTANRAGTLLLYNNALTINRKLRQVHANAIQT